MPRCISILILTIAGLSGSGQLSHLAAQTAPTEAQATLTTDTKARVVTITMGPVHDPRGWTGDASQQDVRARDSRPSM
jgi:hypothetical protein